MLQVSGLSFDYDDKPLLGDLSFAVHPGTVLHVRGKNGAGKTTLLKLLAGLYEPQQGTIFFHGSPILTDRASYQNQLCYLGQKTGLSPLLTLRENYQMGLLHRFHNITLQQAAKQLRLEDLLDTCCGALSTGQLRRASLLRLLIAKTQLWLLDEPFNGLDDKAVNHLIDIISQHIAQKGMVVLASHQTFPILNDLTEEYCL
mgnify:CR=1 FL=1